MRSASIPSQKNTLQMLGVGRDALIPSLDSNCKEDLPSLQLVFTLGLQHAKRNMRQFRIAASNTNNVGLPRASACWHQCRYMPSRCSYSFFRSAKDFGYRSNLHDKEHPRSRANALVYLEAQLTMDGFKLQTQE